VKKSTASLILLVSDDGDTDRRLRTAFTTIAPDYSVGIARSRKEIEASHPPHLFLLDLMLSCESSLDLLRWLRGEPRYEQTPVFVLSSDTAPDEINQAYALGANSCLLTNTQPEGLERIARGIVTYTNFFKTSGTAQVE
jgi:CheY-like chemotaxis protein